MSKRRRSPLNRRKHGPRANPTLIVDQFSRRLKAARARWDQGQRSEALRLYEEVVRQEPNNVRAYIMTARAYAQEFQFERMEETFDKLIRRAHRHPGIHHYLGESYSQLKLPKKAFASFQKAAKLPGTQPSTWMELASLHERAHRLDEAQELIDRTVRSGFDLPMVWLVKARIQRRRKEVLEAESTLRVLIERMPDNSEWTCQAWGELAMIKDSQGDYDGAVEAIQYCKQAQRLEQQLHSDMAEDVLNRLQELIDQIGRDDFRQWRDQASPFPTHRVAVLTGFPRSGTTLLEQILDAHPDLVSSEERDFIGRNLSFRFTSQLGSKSLLEMLNELGRSQIEPERSRYFQVMEYLLGEPIGGRMHLDKNPSYNLTIPLLLRIFPEARLVMALRDPRDVVLSCYLRYLPLNSVSVAFLDIERTARRYAFDMNAWLKFRDLIEVPWCEVRYEDTVGDPSRQARRVLDTLELHWNENVLDYRQRLMQQKQVNSPSYEAVSQPIYTTAIGRWKNYEKLMEPALSILEPFVREFGYSS